MFKVVKQSGLGTIWLPVASGTTLYVGQLVTKSSAGDYLTYFGAAASAGDSKRPLGVVVATNDKTPAYSSTYNEHYISGVQTQDAQLARKWQGAQGMWSAGDPIPMVQVELIGKDTVLLGTFDSALTPFQPAEANTTGNTLKKSETSKRGVNYNTTFYCRSGKNVGIYRVCATGSNSSSVTTYSFNTYWPYAIATSDYYVMANIAPGNCMINFTSTGLYIDPDNALSNYYNVIVEGIDLTQADLETVIFRFA